MLENEPRLPPQRWFWRRCGIIAVATTLIIVTGFCAYNGQPIIASCLTIVFIAGLLCLCDGVSYWGIVLGAFGTAMFSAAFWTPHSADDFIFPATFFYFVFGFPPSFLAAVLFLRASLIDRQRCVANCAGFMLVVFSVVNCLDSGHKMRNYRSNSEAIQETREMLLALNQLTLEIESFRAKHGNVPNDEGELVSFRGKPMPNNHRGYQIRYRVDKDRKYYFEDSASHFWGQGNDIFGWELFFYGPDSVERVHAVLF